MASHFVSNLSEIRRRARQHVLEGAVTSGYEADREKVVALLNEALATEIVCILRYKQHYFIARGIQSEPVAAEFAEHAAEEQAHADRIAQRITQLGGNPDFNPRGLAERSVSEYAEGGSLVQMIEENLVAERIAIDTYHEAIRFIGEKDPTTRRMLEDILANEEEHATELADLLATLDPTRPGPAMESDTPPGA
jgi:bacterioferritin